MYWFERTSILLILTKADSSGFTFNINWYNSFCLFFSTNGKYQELKNGTTPPFKESAFRGEREEEQFVISKTGNKKLDDDFVYTQKHKNIWNSFCNFLDERFAEEDLSEFLDADEVARLKILPAIPAIPEFIPTNVGDVGSSDEDKRARTRAQALADKSYASKKAARLDGLKKILQKFNRATVLVLKHIDV